MSHPWRVVLLWAAATAVLFLAAWGVSLGYLPDSHGQTILIEVQCRDLFEEQIETQILEPLEEAIGSVRGIREVFSVVEREKARILVRFLDSVDLDGAYLDLREVIEATRLSFPENVQRPTILKSDGSGVPVFVASFPPSREADVLRRAFEQIEGAGEIEIGGGFRTEIAVRLDPERLAAARLTAADVVGAIRGANAIGSFGPASSPGNSWVVDGRFRDIQSLQRVAVGGSCLLGEVADVAFRAVRPSSIGRVNGAESLLLYAHAAGDANVVSLTRRFVRAAAGFEGAEVLFDSGRRIEDALLEILYALAVGAGLVVLVTVLFVGRIVPALTVTGSIPLSALAAVATLRLTGYELDLMSLCGVAVGVGIVVDAGLVCLDGYLRLGTRSPAARRATRQPVLFSTATTLAVFVPLLFAPQTLAGRFGGLAVAVAASLCTANLYVFTLLPALLSLTDRPGRAPAGAGTSRRESLSGRFAAAAARRIGRATAAAFLLVRRRRGLAVAAAGGALAGAAALMLALPVQGLTREARTTLRFSVEFPSGVPAQSVFRQAAGLEEALLPLPGVRTVSASYEQERARFSVSLDSARDRETIVGWLRAREARLAEGFLYLPEGESDRDQFDLTLTGPETEPLRQAARELAEQIRGWPEVAGVVLHYKDHQPAQVLYIDPNRSADYGMLPRQVAAQLFWALSFPVADKWTAGPVERDIRVGAAAAQPKEAPPGLQAILDLPLFTPAGAVANARAFVRVAEEPRPGRIYHLNRRRALSFSVAVERGSKRRLLRAARSLVAAFPFPAGCKAEVGLLETEQAEVLRAAVGGLGLALILIFCILMFHFESLSVSLAVMLQLPLSFLLPALLLRLLRLPLCTSTVVGLILTAGLAVNNAIIVLEGARARTLSRFPLACALARKAPVVVAASLTTALGVIPLLFAGHSVGAGGGGVLGPLSLTLAAGVVGSMLALPAGLALVAGD